MSLNKLGHNIENSNRTIDIQISENVNFESMLLKQPILDGLLKNGFKKPSPIQLKAIPLGRLGYDLILQAKSGTGKTAVFGIVALEMIDATKNELQVIIIAPTREIAVQIKEVVQTIGEFIEGLKVEYFIGGISIEEDKIKTKNCHIAVGSPGRLKSLIEMKCLQTNSVRLLVLDEADKLTDINMLPDINFIYNCLSLNRKQLIASSATYTDELKRFLANYMTSPMTISPYSQTPILVGIKQFVTIVQCHLGVIQQMSIKIDELVRILKTTEFNQCIVFCNYQLRAETVKNNLTRLGWPCVYISAAQTQKERLEAMRNLKEFKCRIMCTTDLTARGIDAENIDLVVNFEVPFENETYLHRMGRAGRYGSHGVCITIAADGTELLSYRKMLHRIGGSSYSVPILPKSDVPISVWNLPVSSLEQLYAATVATATATSTTSASVSVPGDDNSIICNTMECLTVTTCNDKRTQKLLNDNIKIIKSISETDSNVSTILRNINEADKKRADKLKSKFNNLDPLELFNRISTTTTNKSNTTSDNTTYLSSSCGNDMKSTKREKTKKSSKKKKKSNNKSSLATSSNELSSSETIERMEIISSESICANTNNRSHDEMYANQKETTETLSSRSSSIHNQTESVYHSCTDQTDGHTQVPVKKSKKKKIKKLTPQHNDAVVDENDDVNDDDADDSNITNETNSNRNLIQPSISSSSLPSSPSLLSSSSSSSLLINNRFNDEAINFQKNQIVNRNLALYNITKLLNEPHDDVTVENINSVKILLTLMEYDEKPNSESLTENQFKKKELILGRDILSPPPPQQQPIVATTTTVKETSDNLNNDIPQWTTVNISNGNDDNDLEMLCQHQQDILSNAYSYAISATGTHWLDTITTTNINHNVCDTKTETTTPSSSFTFYSSEMHQTTIENDYDFDDEQEAIYEGVETVNNTSDTLKETDSSQNVWDEELLLKSYDYAINNNESRSENNICDETGNADCCMTYAETTTRNFGYAASSDVPQHLVTGTRKRTSNFSTNDSSQENLTLLTETSDHHLTETPYASYFEYYMNDLFENGWYFNTVHEFEHYFQQFQNNMETTRNFIIQRMLTEIKTEDT